MHRDVRDPDEKTKRLHQLYRQCLYGPQKYDDGEIEDMENYKERVTGLYQATSHS